MLTLLLVLLVGGGAITVLVWVGGAFMQGYIYTEPNPNLYWQAPAAGFGIGAFFALWCLLDLGAGTPLPFDVIQRFTARIDKYKDPVKEIVAIRKDGSRTSYKLEREADRLGVRNIYKDASNRPWSPTGVIAIEANENGTNVRYERIAADAGAYRRFASADGWFMAEYEGGPTGIPEISRTGRLLGNLLLNVAHLIFWFLALWLLMRFQWPHAFGLAVCLWGLATLIVLPMVLDAAAQAGR